MSDWADEFTTHRCEFDGAEVRGRCEIAGRPWLNEPNRPGDCSCPVVATYRREVSARSPEETR